MNPPVEPMFLDFKAWRKRNTELEEPLRPEIDTECMECADKWEPNEHCDECDGTGERNKFNIDADMTYLMKQIYERYLERDYRLAVQAFYAQPVEVVHG
ncbi:MAG: hypothetical protein Q7U76_12690 [Nitrospirota bacterium]|nr:hypothetical protein [Nitrospirota bacterium]